MEKSFKEIYSFFVSMFKASMIKAYNIVYTIFSLSIYLFLKREEREIKIE